MAHPFPPFTCTYSPNVPELLNGLGCSLTVTTYQAGKFIILSAPNSNDLKQLPRNFDKPMGVAVKDEKIAIASNDRITVFRDSPTHAPTYPDAPDVYDHLFIPRATYFTGMLDAHDLQWVNNKLITVNTKFSCLAEVDEDYSFKPIWKPSFVSDITPEDRCHLNGLAVENDQLKYITALGKSDVAGGWREKKAKGGILIDIASNEIVCQDLAMPHTPRIYDGKLYTLLSATGELICIDTKTGKYDVVNQLNGFVRGMAKFGDYLFIGLSKIREKSSAFRDLPISSKSLFAGIVIIYIPHGSIAGHIKYETSVEEIYDVQVLPMLRPGMVSLAKDTFTRAIATKDLSFWVMNQAQPNLPNN